MQVKSLERDPPLLIPIPILKAFFLPRKKEKASIATIMKMWNILLSLVPWLSLALSTLVGFPVTLGAKLIVVKLDGVASTLADPPYNSTPWQRQPPFQPNFTLP